MKTAIATLLAASALLPTAPAAQADPNTVAFCADLNRQLSPPNVTNPQQICDNTLPTVQNLCIKLYQGWTYQQLMDYRLGETTDKTQAAYIALAVKHFCPEFAGKV
ncbi:DUF732 domain-containing protein [Mycobacterium paragordonae]|uniref:DUF732 domain-containing protein n=1 Tax=Mycobacterium paragordonae TaxID=1389713 RepID=A0ABQ1C4F9_9MYCO|nr:DUF732 domain-containing protein [Mycobacterium paragordonae]GFG79134.1 hypothetical protein MPRG_24100 [Mycobacterium paragordonae]